MKKYIPLFGIKYYKDEIPVWYLFYQQVISSVCGNAILLLLIEIFK